MSPTLRLLLRADAGHAIGLGHLSRMRSLAMAFEKRRPCETVFAVNDLDLAQAFLGPSANVIRADGLYGLPPQDVIMADLPGLPRGELALLRRLGGLLVGIDDAGAGPFACDILIRPTPLPGPKPDNGTGAVWHGGKYVILHPEFARHAAEKRVPPARAGRLLVCFGGSDPAGHTLRSLPLLRALPDNVTFHIVAGAAFAEEDILRSRTSGDHRIRVDIALKDMAGALAQADTALISGGTLLYEACALGVPAAILAQNREQEAEAAFFADQGAALSLGAALHPRNMPRVLDRLLADADLRAGLAAAGRALIAPDGADRIAGNILSWTGVARP